ATIAGVDISLLMVEMGGFKALRLADQLVEKAGLHDVMLLGIQEGKSSLTRPVPTGTGSLVRFKFTTTVPSRSGESGGAWIDISSERVYAVASAVKTSPTGPSYESTPVTLIKPSLTAFFRTAGLEIESDTRQAE